MTLLPDILKHQKAEILLDIPPPLIEMNSLMNENEYSNFKRIAKDFLSKNKPVFVNLFIELVQIQIFD